MQRNEKLMLVRDVPAAIIDALDGVMETQGMARVILREIEEDWTPLLTAEGDPLVFVLSQPHNDWTACFSSLEPDAEWELSEALASATEQPTAYVLLSDATNTVAYRYFADGVLHEEYMPGTEDSAAFDQATLLEKLMQHGVSIELIDDRTQNFGNQHIVVGYGSDNPHNAGINMPTEAAPDTDVDAI